MAWIYLILAGMCEVGWPLGLKLASGANRYFWLLLALTSMGLSSYFLYLAQRVIPMGTAYAIWTGMGAVGAFIVGILYFKDPAGTARVISVLFIVVGIVGLKLSS